MITASAGPIRIRGYLCSSLKFIDKAVRGQKPSLRKEPDMGTNVNLTPQLEDMIRQKVSSGLYTSASEVVREALRLMSEQDPNSQRKARSTAP